MVRGARVCKTANNAGRTISYLRAGVSTLEVRWQRDFYCLRVRITRSSSSERNSNSTALTQYYHLWRRLSPEANRIACSRVHAARVLMTDVARQCEWIPSDIVFVMRPSSLGGGRILRRTLSVCPSVRLSVRPVIAERHVAPPSVLQWHTCTFRQAPRAVYRTAISAAQACFYYHIIRRVGQINEHDDNDNVKNVRITVCYRLERGHR